MKIITWNCNRNISKKIQLLTKLSPDFIVLQECEDINKITFDDNIQPNYKFQFQGANPWGIGIISYSNYEITPVMVEESYIEYNVGIPFIINAPKPFQLLVVWTGFQKILKFIMFTQ
jgi:exonuclease III